MKHLPLAGFILLNLGLAMPAQAQCLVDDGCDIGRDREVVLAVIQEVRALALASEATRALAPSLGVSCASAPATPAAASPSCVSTASPATTKQ